MLFSDWTNCIFLFSVFFSIASGKSRAQYLWRQKFLVVIHVQVLWRNSQSKLSAVDDTEDKQTRFQLVLLYTIAIFKYSFSKLFEEATSHPRIATIIFWLHWGWSCTDMQHIQKIKAQIYWKNDGQKRFCTLYKLLSDWLVYACVL